MTRAYLRLLPDFYDRKALGRAADGTPTPRGAYSADATVALIGVFCLGNKQDPRGRFQSVGVLRAALEGSDARHGRRYARQVPFLLTNGDITVNAGGIVYIEGWDQLQEGDFTVADRLRAYAGRRGDEQPPTPAARRTANWRLRNRIFERDAYTCRYCGRTDYPRDWLVAEHVIPDGPTTDDNLVTACRGCNKVKGSRTPEQAGMVLRPSPEASPQTSPAPSPRASRDGSRDSSRLSEQWAVSSEHLAVGDLPRASDEPITDALMPVLTLIEELTGRPWAFGAGNRTLETLRYDVRDFGVRLVRDTLERSHADHRQHDASVLIWDCHKRLNPHTTATAERDRQRTDREETARLATKRETERTQRMLRKQRGDDAA